MRGGHEGVALIVIIDDRGWESFVPANTTLSSCNVRFTVSSNADTICFGNGCPPGDRTAFIDGGWVSEAPTIKNNGFETGPNTSTWKFTKEVAGW